MLGIHSTFGPFWSMPTSFLGNRAAAGGIALINSIGSLGGFLAPTIIGVLKQQSGTYGSGMIAMGTGLLLTAGIVLALKRKLPAVHAQYS
jgi:ACS family tartrate transporter-like MFS transporter